MPTTISPYYFSHSSLHAAAIQAFPACRASVPSRYLPAPASQRFAPPIASQGLQASPRYRLQNPGMQLGTSQQSSTMAVRRPFLQTHQGLDIRPMSAGTQIFHRRSVPPILARQSSASTPPWQMIMVNLSLGTSDAPIPLKDI